MPDPNAKPDHIVDVTRTVRVGETLAAGKLGVRGLLADAAADTQRETMPRAELLQLVKDYRDERGRMRDTAAYLLLMEVAWCLEMDSAAARSELMQRINAFRRERSGAPDTTLLVLLAEVEAALAGTEPPEAAPLEWTVEEILAKEG